MAGSGRPRRAVVESPLSRVVRRPDVARHYLERALAESHGNKSEAARLLGLPSYQTLTNWMARHGVSGPKRGATSAES